MIPTQSGNPWVTLPQPRPHARVRLFCLPYAGGGSSIYRSWANLFPDSIELCLVQLPGRENRMYEAPYSDMRTLITHAMEGISPFLTKPFAFFGHSMGALVAFELAQTVQELRQEGLAHVFVSGSRAPHLPYPRSSWHLLPDPELLDVLISIQGIPKDLLEHKEYLNLLLPTIRADLRVVATHSRNSFKKLVCPITAFNGSDDELVPSISANAWSEHTSAIFKYKSFEGDHFFLRSNEQSLSKDIAVDLLQSLHVLW